MFTTICMVPIFEDTEMVLAQKECVGETRGIPRAEQGVYRGTFWALQRYLTPGEI